MSGILSGVPLRVFQIVPSGKHGHNFSRAIGQYLEFGNLTYF